MDGIMLGMPGNWAGSKYDAADIYTTKIGGIPDWPISVVTEKPGLLDCIACGSSLSLLAQVYAPVASRSLNIEERVIYVFCCLVPDCESLSWRVLRLQKVPDNDMVHEPASSSVSNKNLHEDLWSLDIGENDMENDDDIDLEELQKAFSEAANISSACKRQNNDAESSKKIQSSYQPTWSIDDKTPVLPCFYIWFQEEKQSKQVTPANFKHASPQKCETDSEDPLGGIKFEEESYEYDRALNADRTYLKFKKHVDAYPEQCIRYSYGGKPLLASTEVGDLGICSLCGRTRHFEMQVMSPLIYFLLEAADEGQNICLEKLDWMTLLVYTCSESCADSSYQQRSGNNEGWIVAEETVIAQYD